MDSVRWPSRRWSGALIVLSLVVLGGAAAAAAEEPPVFTPRGPCSDDGDPGAKGNACLTCHAGIEPIRCGESGMFQAIVARAAESGTGNRCVVCHGGDPAVRRDAGVVPGSPADRALAESAHRGSPPWFVAHGGPAAFYPDPGSPWINRRTCGPCHRWQVEAQDRSLMMTEAGKIQGTLWSFGGLSGYDHRFANYAVKDPDSPQDVVGSDAFRAYLAALGAREPQVFVSEMEGLPAAPDAQEAARDPRTAAYTYLRGECQRCHLGVAGERRHGDYRGMGCSACHIPYGNAGLYQGTDPSIRKDEPGHPLVHRIQSTFEATARSSGVEWSGIPVETCTTCHNRGRRIGVSYQGLMETEYVSPWQGDGSEQQLLHGKRYMKLQEDLHGAKGFLCQDCHTSLDAHGPNKLIGTISAAVEIECTDCHGTTAGYPWELPLGWGDEYATAPATGAARGVSSEPPAWTSQGTAIPPEDGYLLSARGNPLENVVRSGERVKVHLASGEVKTLLPLKGHVAAGDLSVEGLVAMAGIARHQETMECYACHATWAPQCYGCHVRVDYRKPAAHLDWIALGQAHGEDGRTPEGTPAAASYRVDGRVDETRSYLRWEDPALARNGEGRVSPVVPGCQTTVSVLGADGKPLLLNHIFRVPNAEGAGPEGQLAIDMAPLHPHTVQKRARDCDSCHDDPKALGYGIAGGRLNVDPSRAHVVDLESATGKAIAQGTKPQVEAIPNLTMDWSRFVDENGRQLQTVGHHFSLSRPLDNEERAHMDRQGVCLACHREIPDGSLAVSLLHHAAETTGLLPETAAQHGALLHKTLLLSGWVQVAGAFAILAAAAAALVWLVVRRRRRARAQPAS